MILLFFNKLLVFTFAFMYISKIYFEIMKFYNYKFANSKFVS